MKSNVYDTSTTPTGCAASLIIGKTNFRSLNTVVDLNIYHSSTTNFTISNAEIVKYWHDKWKHIFFL